jgi:two-component sensor histidine kinase
VALVLAAFGLRLALEGVYNYPFLTFFPTVLAAALLFGRAMAFLAAVLGAGLAFWFFVEPRYGGAFLLPDRLVVIVAYLAVSWASAAIVEATVAAVEGLEGANMALASANERLAEADAQKAALLDDINHRLKNSLHAVSGLLEADARRAVDPTTRAAVQTAAGRLRILARVHERLRLVPNTPRVDAAVNAADFLGALCDDLRPTLTALRGAALEVEAEAVPMAMAQAIPLGLIVNELVTNAVRHAFPEGQAGLISVVLRRIGDGRLRLEVADNGVGVGPAAPHEAGTGTRILQALVRQLDGSIERQSAVEGTTVVVEFLSAEASI